MEIVTGARHHPHHSLLAREIRGWYSRSYPEMGYFVERERYGAYRHNPAVPDASSVEVGEIDPEDVPLLLEEVRERYGDTAAPLLVNGREEEARLGPALIAAGCSPGSAAIYLAHVGPVPEPPEVPGMAVEWVTEETLTEYALTKLKGFAQSEEQPGCEPVEREVALRRVEMGGEGRFLLARIEGEPAAVLGFYEGEDRLIFNLATRPPFRGRGIATRLLCLALVEARDRDRRSVIINTNPENERAIRLYHGLGFTDEVLRCRCYTMPEGAGG
jgi:ribosomal protein S18 acetylase RimI-like enzyme